MSTEKSRRKERLACVFLFGLTLINAATTIRLIPLLQKGYQDFTTFYGAAEMVRGGQAARLYDLPLQSEAQARFAPDVAIRQAALPYMHPPFEALLFVPLTHLSYLRAYLVWTFLNILMLATTLVITRKVCAEVYGLSPAFVVLSASGFVPLVNGIIQGQDSVFLLLLVTLSFAWLEGRRDVAGGAALGAGLFRFHLVLPMALIMAARRPRLLLGFFPVAATLVSVSAAMSGWRGLADYFRLLFRLERNGAGGAISSVGMPSLRGLIAEVPGGNGGSTLAVVLIVASSVAVAAIAWWMITRPDVSMRFGFALATVAAILLGYHTFTHDLTLLLPVILLVFSAPQEASQGHRWGDTVLLIVVYTLFLGWSQWPRLIPLWFVPLLVWIFWKLRHNYTAEASFDRESAARAATRSG